MSSTSWSAKLDRLPDEAQKALQQLACLGNVADVTTLATVLGTSEDEVHAALWEAVRLELVERQQHALQVCSRPGAGGRLFADPGGAARRGPSPDRAGFSSRRRRPRSREEAIFEIVNQLNRGAELIASQDEREHLAELNLIAGKRAKAATAYASALTYLAAGAALLARRLLDAPACA